jgi:hypothetical protein
MMAMTATSSATSPVMRVIKASGWTSATPIVAQVIR